MKKGLFITGTDTDVGKTIVTTALIRHFLSLQLDVCGVKPICCGERSDVEAILTALCPTTLTLDQINPIYLDEPAAPCSIVSEIPPLTQITQSISELPHQYPIIEGAGGWKVPVCEEWDMESLAQALGLPIVLVVSNKLGALNHSLLTAQAIAQAELPLLGWFLNHVEQQEYTHAQATNHAVLCDLLEAPCLGIIPQGGGEVSSIALHHALKIAPVDGLPLQFQL